MASESSYYVPEQSKWPIVATVGLFLMAFGAGLLMNDMSAGVEGSNSNLVFFAGVAIIIYMLFGWFGDVIKESQQGLYSNQLDVSFRWGMGWFIFSEVMFFAAFFGALYYVRNLSVPWLGGEGAKGVSHMLWPNFVAEWPLMNNPDNELFKGPAEVIDPMHLPLINTILLVISSFTATFAHHALKKNDRTKVKAWLVVTLILGFTFLFFQIEEYIEAYTELGLTLSSGIYGATFFMLTGFHGVHVTLGAIMLTIMLIRVMKGHFTPENHFAFEAASWYWHFVDVVWIGLFVFVYIL